MSFLSQKRRLTYLYGAFNALLLRREAAQAERQAVVVAEGHCRLRICSQGLRRWRVYVAAARQKHVAQVSWATKMHAHKQRSALLRWRHWLRRSRSAREQVAQSRAHASRTLLTRAARAFFSVCFFLSASRRRHHEATVCLSRVLATIALRRWSAYSSKAKQVWARLPPPPPSRKRACARRPGLPQASHSGELTCRPCKQGAAAPGLLAHALVTEQ